MDYLMKSPGNGGIKSACLLEGVNGFHVFTWGASVLRAPGQSTGNERTERKGKQPQKEAWERKGK